MNLDHSGQVASERRNVHDGASQPNVIKLSSQLSEWLVLVQGWKKRR